MNKPVKVLKFGGTSVGSVDRLLAVCDIIARESHTHRAIVVVSAASGVTDILVESFERGTEGTLGIKAVIETLYRRHEALASGLLAEDSVPGYLDLLQTRLNTLADLFKRINGAADGRLREVIIAEGERLSVPLIAQALGDRKIGARAVDASEFIRTDGTYGEANVDFDETSRALISWLSGFPATSIPIITGFIGRDADGNTTTLGRGGSDYSAALIASLLQASVMERWTDVDGIYTDNPRTNGSAKRFVRIQLEEANIWNHAGKLGMHPHALDPLVQAGIPLHVRSTFHPEREGTMLIPSVPLEPTARAIGN